MRRINALMNSMHRRIRAVTDVQGGHTRYWRVNRFHFNILGGTVTLVSTLSCPFRPTDVQLGTNLDYTEANRVG
jgi:hypothetical protein